MSEPSLLADPLRQLEVLTCFLEERPYLEMPQPRGEVVPDTIQAMWQAYVYLSEVGSEVADRETWPSKLKQDGRSILDRLISGATILQGEWEALEQAVKSKDKPLPEIPRTLLEILYEDVTAKSKSAAVRRCSSVDRVRS